MGEENELFFSATSLSEVATKRGLGRRDFPVEPAVLRRNLQENGYRELALTSDHAIALRMLPKIHKDPFDRILIAQAVAEGIVLLTGDQTIARYPEPTRRV